VEREPPYDRALLVQPARGLPANKNLELAIEHVILHFFERLQQNGEVKLSSRYKEMRD
jgi:hypothetical protein